MEKDKDIRIIHDISAEECIREILNLRNSPELKRITTFKTTAGFDDSVKQFGTTTIIALSDNSIWKTID